MHNTTVTNDEEICYTCHESGVIRFYSINEDGEDVTEEYPCMECTK